MSLDAPLLAEKRRKLLYGGAVAALILFIGLGVFAKNGWFPSTDPLTGKRTGWFGKEVSEPGAVATGSRKDGVEPFPNATPQLSKEYIYAGSRLLAVEDANANAAPPADLAVWRPSDGNWYVLGQSGSQQTIAAWGQSGDIPVPGDFDGDGKTDFSIYRPTTGTWWVYYSSNGTPFSANFGASCTPPSAACDITAQADYDGDGKTDMAVFRPSTGVWYIYQSSNGQTLQVTFGSTGDKVTPADYDGDGKSDIAVFRPSNSTFYAYRSSDAQLQQATFGSSGYTPVSADYDGDGKADFALFDPSIDTATNTTSPNWYILQSSNNTAVDYRWGTTGDTTVQNDYDGDGKVDLATWRPANGHWYIRKSASSGALREEDWGVAGDIPVPAYWRR